MFGARAIRSQLHAHARVTVWAENIPELPAIYAAAKEAGCTELSLLASDTSSAGFGDRAEVRGTPPRADQLPALQAFLEGVRSDPFVVMSDYSASRLVLLSKGEGRAPRCSAPWTSGVWTRSGVGGTAFFLASEADVAHGLKAAMRGSS